MPPSRLQGEFSMCVARLIFEINGRGYYVTFGDAYRDQLRSFSGYADNFGGVKCNLPAVSKFLGEFYYLASEGTRIKPWPCCGGTHQTLTGVMELIQKYETNPDEVELIEHIGPVAPCTGAVLRAEVKRGLEG